jgi:hypothetical protein
MDIHNIAILTKESNVDEVNDSIVYSEVFLGCYDDYLFLLRFALSTSHVPLAGSQVLNVR